MILTPCTLGYKLRTQISKALKSCATAIQSALQWYNKYAADMSPPHPPLEWEHIVEYSFVAEFDLLHDSDAQLHSKQWANPPYRQASIQYFDGMHAKEEIQQLNVEIGRLLTKICDDAVYYPQTIKALVANDPPLASELGQQWHQLRSINFWHLQCIHQIQGLSGYSGPLEPGTHIGVAAGVMPNDSLPDSVTDIEDIDSEDLYDGEHMQQVEGYINGLDHHIVDDM